MLRVTEVNSTNVSGFNSPAFLCSSSIIRTQGKEIKQRLIFLPICATAIFLLMPPPGIYDKRDAPGYHNEP